MEAREATQADAPDIARIHLAGWQGPYRGIIADEVLDALTLEPRLRFWESYLADPPPAHRTFVSVIDGGVVGFVNTGPARDEDLEGVELYSIYIEPERIGSGVGRGLLAEAMSRAAADGYSSMSLWVLTNNPLARRFYERNGWTTDGAVRTEKIRTQTVHEVRYRVAM